MKSRFSDFIQPNVLFLFMNFTVFYEIGDTLEEIPPGKVSV